MTHALTREEAAAQTDAGRQLLSERLESPEWLSKLLAEGYRFDFMDADNCVLGILFGSYHLGKASLGIETDDEAELLGFTVPSLATGDTETFDDNVLVQEQAWRDLIYGAVS